LNQLQTFIQARLGRRLAPELLGPNEARIVYDFGISVLALVAEDVPATIEALRSKGVEILTEPHRPPWRPGRTVAEFRDSEGNRLMLGSP